MKINLKSLDMRIKEMLSHKKSLNILKKTNALIRRSFCSFIRFTFIKIYSMCKIIKFSTFSKKFVIFSKKIKKKFKSIDLILAPAMGGVIIGYEIGRLLKKETIFCERVNGKFILRRGFNIKKGSKF